MAEIRRCHPRQPHPQNHGRTGIARRTGRPVRASGARIGRSPVPLSVGEERDDGAQHARHGPALAVERPGSAHHPRHDRGAGQKQISGQDVTAVLFLVLAVVVLAAIAFAIAPLWGNREHRPGEVEAGSPSGRATQQKGRGLLAGAIALFLLGIGGGTYWMLGQPYLAWRSAQGVETRDVNGLIALLVKRVRAV